MSVCSSGLAARSCSLLALRRFPCSISIRPRLRSFSSTQFLFSKLQRTPLFEALQKHDGKSIAIVHPLSGRSFTYASLVHDVATAKQRLLASTGQDLTGRSVAFLTENSYDYVVTLLALLATNARAVPLAPSFPVSELRYIVNHSGADALLFTGRFTKLASDVLSQGVKEDVKSLQIEKTQSGSRSTEAIELVGMSEQATGGLMLYTSGTTARPKGVLLDQSVLMAQAKSLLEAWQYSSKDHLLHVLPLHHIHGTVNALITPLMAGSTIEFLFPFNPDRVWERLSSPFVGNENNAEISRAPITFFTAVPTVWSRLLKTHPTLSPDLQIATKEAIQRKHLRLNISGSAALPVPVKQAWTDLSDGNTLLERYGMTEVGMALSCGLANEDRIDGSVGWPLPSVETRLVDIDTDEVIPIGRERDANGTERPGEIQLRGPTIFKGYWQDEAATRKEFTSDGWFKTGDVAIRRDVPGTGHGRSGDWAQGPAYFILGRQSADIIKTGGEKVSALEVERELLSLPEVSECAVVALRSETWDQKGAAVVVLTEVGKTAVKGGKAWGPMDMRRALKDRLAIFKIPQELKVVEEIPRNAMGKVNKKELVAALFGDGQAIRGSDTEVAAQRANTEK